jgi:hypothetical protein
MNRNRGNTYFLARQSSGYLRATRANLAEDYGII